jgi:tetratricopeptide (TPR) repeat protein
MTALIRYSSGLFLLGTIILIIYSTEKSITYKREGVFTPLGAKVPLSPDFLRIASLNNNLTVADVLYLRTLIYTGEYLNSSDTHWLFTYYDTITELDPKFEYAYLMGGISLSIFCYNAELSNRILLKGIKEFQENWRIPFLIGFNYYYELGDFLSGARYMEIASKLPGAPSWLSFLAVRLYSTAGDIDTAIETLKRLISMTQNEKLRSQLKQNLKLAIIEKVIRPMEKAVKEYRNRFKKYPDRLDALVKAGILQRIPSEPFGGYFYIDENGTVWSSTIKERLKIYIPEDLNWKLEKDKN